MSNKTILTAVVLTLAIVIGLIVLVNNEDYWSRQNSPEVPAETVTKRAPFASQREAPEGFAEYRNVFHRFQLLHPDTLEVTEDKVGPGTTLITFVSTIDNRSFQIFIVPHGEEMITEFRLQSDLPSGVMNNQQQTMIDGVSATIFESEADGIGPTREVWFINKGFLYEVTTSLENDAWLSEIMTDWMFL